MFSLGPDGRNHQLSCVCLHGDRKPNERKNNLERFKVRTKVKRDFLTLFSLCWQLINILRPSRVHRKKKWGCWSAQMWPREESTSAAFLTVPIFFRLVLKYACQSFAAGPNDFLFLPPYLQQQSSMSPCLMRSKTTSIVSAELEEPRGKLWSSHRSIFMKKIRLCFLCYFMLHKFPIKSKCWAATKRKERSTGYKLFTLTCRMGLAISLVAMEKEKVILVLGQS